MIWWFIVIFIVALVVGYAMTPKPKGNTPPAGLDQVQAPTAQEGREIAVLFGTKDVSGPNVVWYGDFRSVAIQKKGGKK